jgi:hypothetical protein
MVRKRILLILLVTILSSCNDKSNPIKKIEYNPIEDNIKVVLNRKNYISNTANVYIKPSLLTDVVFIARANDDVKTTGNYYVSDKSIKDTNSVFFEIKRDQEIGWILGLYLKEKNKELHDALSIDNKRHENILVAERINNFISIFETEMKIEDISMFRKKYGEPVNITTTKSKGQDAKTDVIFYTYKWRDQEYRFIYIPTENRIILHNFSIQNNNKIKILDIGIDSERNKVITLLGQPNKEDDNVLQYNHQNEKLLLFHINEDKLTSIEIQYYLP